MAADGKKTMQPPAEGCVFTYHTLVCPLSDFAKKYGYEEYPISAIWTM